VLKKTRYLWLKNPNNLTDKQRRKLQSLAAYNLKTARAYQIRLILKELFEQPNREVGEAFLKRWHFWAMHSRNWFDSMITIGLLEGFNSLIQTAKARARGYQTNRNLITTAYLIAGQLKFNLPT